MKETVSYLRRVAQTCSQLARKCPDPVTSHGLEAVAADLAAKATEIEGMFAR
jgi:hypothetical protein